MGTGRKKKVKYRKDFPKMIYTFFVTYKETGSIPSFEKFAQSIGATLAEIESFKRYGEFERAWRECAEIRKDILIDSALCKKFDSSLVKFLLASEYRMGDEADEGDNSLSVTLEIV